jgi:hypothetical protein
MAWSAHHLVGDAEHIHDVEGEQRDMRRLEHIAASVKHEVRGLRRRRYRRRFLAEPLQQLAIELQTRQHGHIAAEIAVPLHAEAAPVGQLASGLGEGEACHRQQEARIDAVIAGLDALAAEHARCGPSARRFGSIAAAYDVEHAADDVLRARIRDAGGFHAGADLDTFAAPRAGIEHVRDAFVEGRLERDVAIRLHIRPSLNVDELVWQRTDRF